MMTKLINMANKNAVLGFFIRIACAVAFFFISLWDEITGSLRMIGIGGGKYKSLKKYKNIHKGERCFVICTGPSLTIEDCEKLQDEKTFCMNSFCKVYDQTSFRPTYFGVQDHIVFPKVEDDMKKYYSGADNVFVSDRITLHSKTDPSWNVFPLNISYNAYDRWFTQKFHAKFSGNVYRTVYNGFSITMSLMQIAVYMGFKEIYLLGADCSFPKGQKIHFVEHGVVDTTLDTARDRNIAGYEAAKKYCDAHGVKIYNATRGGALEVFPRVNLDDVLAG